MSETKPKRTFTEAKARKLELNGKVLYQKMDYAILKGKSYGYISVVSDQLVKENVSGKDWIVDCEANDDFFRPKKRK